MLGGWDRLLLINTEVWFVVVSIYTVLFQWTSFLQMMTWKGQVSLMQAHNHAEAELRPVRPQS